MVACSVEKSKALDVDDVCVVVMLIRVASDDEKLPTKTFQ